MSDTQLIEEIFETIENLTKAVVKLLENKGGEKSEIKEALTLDFIDMIRDV
jgi:hypothetical protein